MPVVIQRPRLVPQERPHSAELLMQAHVLRRARQQRLQQGGRAHGIADLVHGDLEEVIRIERVARGLERHRDRAVLVQEVAPLPVQHGCPPVRLGVTRIGLARRLERRQRLVRTPRLVVQDPEGHVRVGQPVAGGDGFAGIARGRAGLRVIEHPQVEVVVGEETQRTRGLWLRRQRPDGGDQVIEGDEARTNPVGAQRAIERGDRLGSRAFAAPRDG